MGAYPNGRVTYGKGHTVVDVILSALHIDASYLVAFLLVGFYAWSRFNTPKTIRSQTSQFQYFGSCATYVTSSLGLLMLVACSSGKSRTC